MSKSTGLFVLSLDFELHWGVWDVASIEKYGNNILGVQQAIPQMLAAFEKYKVKATFATVGFLFAENKAQLLTYLPQTKPTYAHANFNVYKTEIQSIGNNEGDDPYHFGYSLLQQIKNAGHEIGTHTFSHYYGLEDGQTAAQFDADLKAAITIAKKESIAIKSIVFPRNQINPEYLDILKANGITHYRGNPTGWVYKPRKHFSENIIIRFCRLLDAYTPLFGYNVFELPVVSEGITNVPGSRFLKPYNPKLHLLEKLKLSRIINEMTYAAKNGKMYHLWWHPHNFGANLEENMEGLHIILAHYKKLEEDCGFRNEEMGVYNKYF
jgi:peptidoglycan/xylan/chitin deacetylase (PgdA/CDA1 family)